MTILKEPFVHFALLGVAIFAWFALTNPEELTKAAPDQIVVDQRLVETMSAQFSARMNRAPRLEEMEAILDRNVRDEIMVREALELGLDEGDGIVRNRLVQKMGFLVTSVAQSAMPDDAALQQHLEENADKFRTPASATFEQYGLAQGLSEEDVASVLAQLRAGEVPQYGSRLQLLPAKFDNVDARRADGNFGSGFFARIAELPAGEWAGPVQSGFGLHLVRLNKLVPGGVPALDEIRDAVLLDWRSTLTDQLTEAQVAALMDRYDVIRPTADELRSWISR